MRNALFVTGSFFTFSYRVHTQSARSDDDRLMRVTVAPFLGVAISGSGGLIAALYGRPESYRRMARMYRPARLKQKEFPRFPAYRFFHPHRRTCNNKKIG
jgi:hypothetical protein